jgi:17 kDa outer membrane surface antigen
LHGLRTRRQTTKDQKSNDARLRIDIGQQPRCMNKMREHVQGAAMRSGEANANKGKRRHARPDLIFILRGIAARSAAACALAVLVAAGPALPVLADPAPREVLPSREAIGWLLETEATGSASPWVNSRSGYSGTVTITRTWDQADGALCRTYTVAAVAGGAPTVLKGTGCRAGLGEWNLREEAPAVMATARPSPPAPKPPAPAAMEAADSALAAAPPTPTSTALPPAPPAPVDDDAAGAADPAPAHLAPTSLTADTAEHKPGPIAGSLPSRSDE